MSFFRMSHLYELVGEAVYGRGKAGRGKVSQTNDDRGKDAVPKLSLKTFLFL